MFFLLLCKRVVVGVVKAILGEDFYFMDHVQLELFLLFLLFHLNPWKSRNKNQVDVSSSKDSSSVVETHFSSIP